MSIELDIKKINNLSENLKDVCIGCKGYEKLCYICPVNNSLKELNINYLETKYKSDIDISDLILNRNKIFLIQDSLEDICSECNSIGIDCKTCYIHKIKRELSSLPVKNKTITFDPSTNNTEKSSCGTGGSCGTSCG